MTKYFVYTSGNDTTGNGLSIATAFKSLSKAASVAVSGDEIEVGNGYFSGVNQAVFNNKNNISIYAAANAKPLFAMNVAQDGLVFNDCSYITVFGLTYLGVSNTLTYANALASYNAGGYSPTYDANGISFNRCHHVSVIKTVVRDFPGAGIYFGYCDYAKASECVVSGCTKYSQYGCQGITFLYAKNSPGAVAGAERITAEYCHCYDNINYIPWREKGTINEGAGIYNDSTKDDKAGNTFTGVARFAYNLCTYNGAAGIHVLNACPTTVEYNFVNTNNRNFPNRGEVVLDGVPNVSFTNNEVGTGATFRWINISNSPNAVATGNTVRGTTLQTLTSSPGANVSGNTFL